jgi:DNA-binding NarL/FixJ family response regulator
MHVTIAVADDHRLVREGIRRLLESRAGFEVVGEAASGEDAERLILELRPRVALLDIGMSGISGIEVTRRIRRAGVATRVVVLSMNDCRESVDDALRAGASAYVVKHASPGDLFEAIEAACNGSTYLSPPLSRSAPDAPGPSSAGAGRGVAALTDREREVLRLIAEGYSSKGIAALLGVSYKTVETHRTNLMDKVGIHKVPGLVRLAIRDGLVTP